MKYYDKNVSKLLVMNNKNLLEDSGFKPFIDYIKSTEWYFRLVDYCERKNKDVSNYFDKMFVVEEVIIGYTHFFVPRIITSYDIQEQTEIFIKYNELLKEKIKN